MKLPPMMVRSFPFHFDTIHGGLTTVSGVCRCEEDGIVCEFRSDFGGIGLKSGIKEARLLYSEIDHCQFRKSWFGSGVRIYPASLKVMEPFPTHQDDHLMFHVKRRDRSLAALAASEIDLRAVIARTRLLD